MGAGGGENCPMNPEGAKKAGKELIPKITQIEVSTVACFPFHSLSPSASLPTRFVECCNVEFLS